MVESIINCGDSYEANVVLLCAGYEKTTSFGKGAGKGPEAIINCLDKQIEIFERETKTEPLTKTKIAIYKIDEINKLEPKEMTELVGDSFEKFYEKGKFVITLGGEHSVSNGPLSIIKKPKYSGRPEDVTVFQIDAHFDLRNDDSDYAEKPHGKYAHSTVMRRTHELGLNIVSAGIRAYSKEEHDFAVKNGITFFEWGRKIPTLDQIVDSIKTDKVYLTLDVDGIDPAYMPATGTPVQGGLEWYYTLDLLKELFSRKEIIATDVVEVAPRPHDTLTEYGAAQIVYNMIAFQMQKK